MVFKLLKIFLSNIFSFGEFTESFKKGPKGIFKNIFIILCSLYLIFVFVAFYIMFITGVYSNLEIINHLDLFPGISLFLALAIIFFFGMISVASSYYAGNGEEQFLSMPITSTEFFGAKFGTSFVTESFIGIFLFAISSGYYGYKQGLLSNPLFYIGTIVTALTCAVVSICLIYFLLSVVLFFIPAFRKRSVLNGIGSIFVIIFALIIGYSSGFSGGLVSATDGESVTEIMTGPVATLAGASKDIAFLSFFGKALNGKILPIVILLAIAALVIFVFVPLIGKIYIKTFEGASDMKQKKVSRDKIDKVVKTETKKQSVFKAMFVRDVRGVFREPTFFANGPLLVFLMPVIFIIALIMPFIINGEGRELLQDIRQLGVKLDDFGPEVIEKIKYYACFGLTAISLFVGNMSMVASTSFSREGKGFYSLKAMPIDNSLIVKVKFYHALLYVLISFVIFAVLFLGALFFIGMPFSFRQIMEILLISLFTLSTISILLVIIDMLFDTLNPKLNWETPTAAFKQNMNTMFGMLVSIGVVGIFIAVIIACGMLFSTNISIIAGVGIIFGIIAAPVGSAYFKYAEKKINIM